LKAAHAAAAQRSKSWKREALEVAMGAATPAKIKVIDKL
jgi:hypothetical protein